MEDLDDLGLGFVASRLGSASGDPAIFLPGGPCRGVEYLGNLAGLGEDRALVVLHPRGTPTSGGFSRGWWADAGDVIALADAIGLASFDLIGHSAGTRLALATAAQFTSRVRSLLLITPPATWLSGTASDVDVLAAQHADPAAREGIRLLSSTEHPDTEAGFRALFRRQAPAGYAHWTETTRAHSRIGEVSRRSAGAWFQDIPDEVADRILETALPPAHVIGGDRDYLTGLQPVLDYAERLEADATMIHDCGHYPWVEQPDTFRRTAGAWLAHHAR